MHSIRTAVLACTLARFLSLEAQVSSCSLTTNVPPLSESTVVGNVSYNDLVEHWITATGHSTGGAVNTAVAYEWKCSDVAPNAWCLLVPKYGKSDVCTVATMDASACGTYGATSSARQFRQVTDELSQIGLGLAMAGSTQATRFDRWVNTIRLLRQKSNDAILPWDVTAALDQADETKMCVRDANDASDATARVITALYIAAHTLTFSSADRDRYEALADELANRLARMDHKDTRNLYPSAGRFWLAGGKVQADNAVGNANGYTYGGYFGDHTLAMLAAYRSTGEPRYAELAQDAVRNYLNAAAFISSFRVPPLQFSWKFVNGEPAAEPRGYLAEQWDDADAPRAVTLCKSGYYARLANVTLPADLDRYCHAWMLSDGVQIDGASYQRQYTFDGHRIGDRTVDYINTGLGASLNFYLCPADLQKRLDAAMAQYSAGDRRFRSGPTESAALEACFGVYMHAFFVVNYGSAIGRDLVAFRSPLEPPSNVSVSSTGIVTWNAVPGAATYDVFRSCNGETYSRIGSTAATILNGGSGAPAQYKVRAVAADGARSRFSAPVSPDTRLDRPLVPAHAVIAAADLVSIRDALNAARAAAGLPAVSFTETIATYGRIEARDFAELKQKIDASRSELNRPAYAYKFNYATGSVVTARAVEELREAARLCAEANTYPPVLP